MNKVKEQLLERKNYLQEVIRKVDSNIAKANRATENKTSGSVYAMKHRRGYQYYLKDCDNVRYLKSAEVELARKIVQNEYEHKALKAAKREYNSIERMLAVYNNKLLEDVYETMPAGKRKLINPIRITDEEYLEKWKSQHYDSLRFMENSPEYYSVKGERMRSKSEVIIANMLNTLNIEYLYEKPLKLNGLGVVHPDFTLLNLKERKEIYWEHLGMLDDQEYRDNAIRKIRCYENTGYFHGDRLIVTEESSNCPLDIKLIEKQIRFILNLK